MSKTWQISQNSYHPTFPWSLDAQNQNFFFWSDLAWVRLERGNNSYHSPPWTWTMHTTNWHLYSDAAWGRDNGNDNLWSFLLFSFPWMIKICDGWSFFISAPFLFSLFRLNLLPDLLLHQDTIISMSTPVRFLAPFITIARLNKQKLVPRFGDRGGLLPSCSLHTCCLPALLRQHGRTSRYYLLCHWHSHSLPLNSHWHSHSHRLLLQLQRCPFWLSFLPSEFSWSFSFSLHLGTSWECDE